MKNENKSHATKDKPIMYHSNPQKASRSKVITLVLPEGLNATDNYKHNIYSVKQDQHALQYASMRYMVSNFYF